MSDDERMDRARRIRRMREGRRNGDHSDGRNDEPTDAESESPDTESESPDAEATGQESSEAQGTQTVAADSADTIEGPASADEWFEERDEAADPSPQAPTEDDVDERADEASTDDDASDAGATESASAAASAAAAFEVAEPQPASESDDQESVDAEATAERATESAGDSAESGSATEQTADGPERESETRVLEFRLGDEHYCLDIEYVEEIVKEESVTRVPNTPDHVHGVVDLRGQITTILDPKVELDIEDNTDEQLIVVFGDETFEDQGHAGWIVDEVRQVLPITESEVKESPLDRQYIKGVIERDEEFIIWTEPEAALEQGEE
ncbi:MAG: chemotaxis protein CheW [Halapricum sp.]